MTWQNISESQVYPGGAVLLDDSFQIVFITPRFSEIFEIDAEAYVGLPLETMFSPKDRRGSISFHNKLSQYEGGFIDVVLILKLHEQDYLSRLRMTRQQGLWVAIFENILAETEDLFRQFHLGRERWTSIVRNSSEGIAMLDTDGNLVEFNSRFLEMMQFRSEHGVLLNEDAIFNRNLFDLLVYPKANELVDAFELAKTKKNQFVQEVFYRQKFFMLELTPIYFPVQGFVGCSFVIKDLSAKKELEQVIADLDAYAHSVAHDLKNPLGLIMNYSDMVIQMAGDDISDKMKRYLSKIAQSGEKMNSIINELLMLARVRGETDIQVVPINMGQVVSDAIDRMGIQLAHNQAIVDTPEKWPSALGYAPWVEEIWVNYISNAIKYGGTPPRIQLGAEPDRDHMVRFWIKDNGKGIDDEVQTLLFNEFTRLEMHELIEGHGLGLSIVQRIIRKLGGEVGLESTPGKGSLFYFTLPSG